MRFSILPTAATAAAMLASLLFTSVSSAAAIPLPPGPYCPPRYVLPSQQRALFDDFVQIFYNEANSTEALLKYASVDLIQHNPDVGQGLAAQIAAVPPIFAVYSSNIQFTSFDESKGYGLIFNKFAGKPGTGLPITGVADVWRWSGTCIVEHWDVIEPLSPNATNPMPF